MTYELEEVSPEGDWHLHGDIRVASAHDLYDDLAIARAFIEDLQ